MYSPTHSQGAQCLGSALDCGPEGTRAQGHVHRDANYPGLDPLPPAVDLLLLLTGFLHRKCVVQHSVLGPHSRLPSPVVGSKV